MCKMWWFLANTMDKRCWNGGRGQEIGFTEENSGTDAASVFFSDSFVYRQHPELCERQINGREEAGHLIY